MPFNYTLQDVLRLSLAVLLFTSVSVFPGYVIGWTLNIFSFKQRTPLVRYVIAVALSNALTPVLLFLVYRNFSNLHGIGFIAVFFVAWAVIQIKSSTQMQSGSKLAGEAKVALGIAAIWILFCVLLLVDIQAGSRLYFNAAAYDFTSRVALIEAITRTGTPPINPTYYPGHFERITELYYFWYILGSAVDQIGGKSVDARISLFAGIIWSGLALAATLATYLRVRNHQGGINAWRAGLIGSQLIAVSGLDFIPVMTLMIVVKAATGFLPFGGLVEAWNIPVMSWLNALVWVPNHVAGTAACMIALLAILSSFRESKSQRIIGLIVAGFSIGSALGLSTWVALTFGIFMAVWGIAALFSQARWSLLSVIVTSGIIGLALASQFLLTASQPGGTSNVSGSFPLSFYVRRFWVTGLLPPGWRDVVGVLCLPVNYFFELGFFFVIAVLWLRQKRKLKDNPYYLAEMLLLATVVILLSFVKSTVLLSNDLGMRGWLLGQFVLIIWTVDIFNALAKDSILLTPMLFKSTSLSRRIGDLLTALLVVGILTTTLEAVATRFWTVSVDVGLAGVPNELSPDMNLGSRTYDARLAYEYIRDHTPQNIIVQNNPVRVLDRPSGLYGTRQIAIGDRTAYGVPSEVFKEMSTSVGRIFLAENVTDWASTDELCNQYSIQVIIVNDADPLWSSLSTLKEQRAPLYINGRYAVFTCGDGN